MNEFKYIATKLLNLTEDEVVSKFFDGDELKATAADELLSVVETKIKAAKQVEVEAFNKGFKKAEAKYKSEAENTIKEVLGIEITDGEDLSEAVTKWHAESKKTKTTLTDDDVKKHPLYRQLEKERVPKEEHEKMLAEFDSYKSQAAKREVLAQIKPKVWGVVTQMNPKLPTDTKVAETYRNMFLNSFDEYDYQIENDDVLILKDGKRVEDSYGNPLKFHDFVKANATNYFEFNKQQATGGAGNKNEQPVTGGVNTPMPKSWDEFNKTRSTLVGQAMLDYSKAGRAYLEQLGIQPE